MWCLLVHCGFKFPKRLAIRKTTVKYVWIDFTTQLQKAVKIKMPYLIMSSFQLTLSACREILTSEDKPDVSNPLNTEGTLSEH